MLQTLKLLKNEGLVNIKELQKSPSRHLQGVTRILRGKTTLGYFFAEDIFSDLIEDMEAISSPKYLKSVMRARQSKKLTPLSQIEKRYGI
ncbi:MAG: hypothetical protein HY569_00445 [Candidatus Magasanikbacteria bacterium]|nr:hypothetical protein [Candidatus Magasanikbacteria bacterium]